MEACVVYWVNCELRDLTLFVTIVTHSSIPHLCTFLRSNHVVLTPIRNLPQSDAVAHITRRTTTLTHQTMTATVTTSLSSVKTRTRLHNQECAHKDK